MADCSKVRTTGHWKGHPCGSPGLYLYNGDWTCANHFPIEDALAELDRTKRALEIAEADSQLLTKIIDVSNHGDPILDESIWDDLPGDSEDVQAEVRAALRTRVSKGSE